MTVAGHVGPRWLIGQDQQRRACWLSGVHHWHGVGAGTSPTHRDIGLRVEGHAPALPADDG